MNQSQSQEMTAICTENLPFHKPRHLLGVGLPIQVLYGIKNGVDTFDCVLPLRKAQRGIAYTSGGEVYYKHVQPENMKNEPLDPLCSCTTCQNYTREQLRQLFKTDKVKAGELASIHNIYFYNDMMKNARIAIQKNHLISMKNLQLGGLKEEDLFLNNIKNQYTIRSAILFDSLYIRCCITSRFATFWFLYLIY